MTDESGGTANDHGDGEPLHGIKDVARQLGVSQRTLRFYEDKGLVQPRRAGSTRVYSRREIGRMQIILRGKRLGFTLREIAEYLDLYDADPEHVEQARLMLANVEKRLKVLTRQRKALDETIAELKAIGKETQAYLDEH